MLSYQRDDAITRDVNSAKLPKRSQTGKVSQNQNHRFSRMAETTENIGTKECLAKYAVQVEVHLSMNLLVLPQLLVKIEQKMQCWVEGHI